MTYDELKEQLEQTLAENPMPPWTEEQRNIIDRMGFTSEGSANESMSTFGQSNKKLSIYGVSCSTCNLVFMSDSFRIMNKNLLDHQRQLKHGVHRKWWKF